LSLSQIWFFFQIKPRSLLPAMVIACPASGRLAKNLSILLILSKLLVHLNPRTPDPLDPVFVKIMRRTAVVRLFIYQQKVYNINANDETIL